MCVPVGFLGLLYVVHFFVIIFGWLVSLHVLWVTCKYERANVRLCWCRTRKSSNIESFVTRGGWAIWRGCYKKWASRNLSWYPLLHRLSISPPAVSSLFTHITCSRTSPFRLCALIPYPAFVSLLLNPLPFSSPPLLSPPSTPSTPPSPNKRPLPPPPHRPDYPLA